MSRGKAHAQSGHAYLDAWLSASLTHPDIAGSYAALKPGTKICLAASAEDIRHLEAECRARTIPFALIIDRDHVEPPDFDGSPILTALGIGPLTPDAAKSLLGHLPLWPGRDRKKGGGMT
jgi:PTH2 family peptidyl-tRNA hydrolase